MNEAEAYLMLRMQLALLMEGQLHHPPAGARDGWLDAVHRLAGSRLDSRDRHTLRHWGPGT